MTQLEWKRSSFCDTSVCAEWADDRQNGMVWLRDSADNMVGYTYAEWNALIAAAAAGECAVGGE